MDYKILYFTKNKVSIIKLERLKSLIPKQNPTLLPVMGKYAHLWKYWRFIYRFVIHGLLLF